MRSILSPLLLSVLLVGCSSEKISYRPISSDEISAIQPADYGVAPISEHDDFGAIIPIQFSKTKKYTAIFFESAMIDSVGRNIAKSPQLLVTAFNPRTGEHEVTYYYEIEGDELIHEFRTTDLDHDGIQELRTCVKTTEFARSEDRVS